MIPNTTSARPEDDTYNIQRGRPASRNSTNGLRSTSPSPMDDSSPPSEVDYAERVAANCNMDIEIVDPSLPSVTNFIRSYLHQFFDNSHGLKASLKPLRRPFDRCQSRLEAINNGRDIKQINW